MQSTYGPWVGLFDSFADVGFGGNVAGVVVADQALSDHTMALLARELNAPTTGFVLVDDRARSGLANVRFFTPKQEIAACGHVTIAVAQAMLQRRVWSTDAAEHWVLAKGGKYRVGFTVADGVTLVEMHQTLIFIEEAPVTRGMVSNLLGDMSLHRGLPLRVASTGLRHLLVPADSACDLAALKPDTDAVTELAARAAVDTVAIFVVEQVLPDGARVRMRDLCAGIGDLEEPASGTTAGALTAYVHRVAPQLLGRHGAVMIRMGSEIGRPSRIDVSVAEDQAGVHVRVCGRARLVLDGRLNLDHMFGAAAA